MALSTTQYGYIVDPMVPFTAPDGRTIRNGYVKVFLAGSSTPVITYANFDGTANQERIELDNSGRTAYPVIVSKGNTYKVCVYDAEHSQESPILTIDKVVPAGANVEATNIVTGLDNVESPEAGWVKSTVSGTDAEVSLDATNVTSEVDTMVKATAASADYMMPLVHKTGSDPDKKITLGNILKFVLDNIVNLATTITSFASGDYFVVGRSAGAVKMSKDSLMTETSQTALAGNVAPAFDPTRTSANPYKTLVDFVVYNGKTYVFRNDHYGPWDPADVIQFDLSSQWLNRLMANVAVYNWGDPATIPDGSLVRHNGIVYLALEDLHYADGFDYDKVMEFSIEKVLNVLKSDQPFSNIVPELKYIYNKILDASGVEQDLSSGLTSIWVITDYIPVTAGKLYKLRYSGLMSSGKYSALYDSSKNFVKSFTISANSSYVMKVPEGVSFVRFSIIINKNTLVRNLSITELPIDSEIGFFEKYRYSPNYLLSERKEGYYIDSTGAEVASSTGSMKWEITDYIPVTEGETLYYYNLNITGSTPMSAWYDSDKTFVSSFKQGQGKLLKVVVPSGVSFVRFSFLWINTDGTNFKFGVFDDCVKLNKMLVDSVQSTEYSASIWSDDYLCVNGDSIEAQSSGLWPVSLASNIPWANSSNIAVGGTRMAGQINSDTRIANIPATATIVITGGGTNDWAQDIPIGSLDTIDDPTTFYGAVHLYIQKVKTRVPDAIVVMISNPFGCCPSRFDSSHDDTLGIWNNNDNTLFDYAQAMKAVANFDSCYYIPVYEECGINAFNYTEYLLHEYNSGAGVWVYLHPNSDGAALIEKVIETHLKRIAELYQ